MINVVSFKKLCFLMNLLFCHKNIKCQQKNEYKNNKVIKKLSKKSYNINLLKKLYGFFIIFYVIIIQLHKIFYNCIMQIIL